MVAIVRTAARVGFWLAVSAAVVWPDPAAARWAERARGDSAVASERATNTRVRMELACTADVDLTIRLSGQDADIVASAGLLGPTPMEINTRRGVATFPIRFARADEDGAITAPSPGAEFIRAISDGSSLTIRGLARERLARFPLSGINRVMRTLRSRCGDARVEAGG